VILIKYKKIKKSLIIMLLLTIFIAILGINLVSAASVKVTEKTINSTSSGGIKSVANSIGQNGIIYLKNGVYKGANNYNITISNKNITIIGQSQKGTIIDGGGVNKIFTLTGGAKLQLINVTIRNGKSSNGGAILNYNSYLVVKNCYFNNNYGNNGGGVIFNYNGNLVISNSYFTNNVATNLNGGGAIYNTGTLYVTNTNFTNNRAYYTIYNESYVSGSGGAIYNKGNSTIINSLFNNNTAMKDGGAIFNVAGNKAPLRLVNSSFINNYDNWYDNKALYQLADQIKANFTTEFLKNISASSLSDTKYLNNYTVGLANAVLKWVQINIEYPSYTGNYNFSQFLKSLGYSDQSHIRDPTLILNDELNGDGYGVCEGTARLTVAMLRYLGIPANYNSDGTHAWLVAYIDGDGDGSSEWLPGETTTDYFKAFSVDGIKWHTKKSFVANLKDYTNGALNNNYCSNPYNLNIYNCSFISTYQNNNTTFIYNATFDDKSVVISNLTFQ